MGSQISEFSSPAALPNANVSLRSSRSVGSGCWSVQLQSTSGLDQKLLNHRPRSTLQEPACMGPALRSSSDWSSVLIVPIMPATGRSSGSVEFFNSLWHGSVLIKMLNYRLFFFDKSSASEGNCPIPDATSSASSLFSESSQSPSLRSCQFRNHGRPCCFQDTASGLVLL